MSQDSAGMHDATPSRTPPRPVDNTDWLKTAAIICVSAGHFGFFFMEDELWWSVFGRFAAPPFFFLVGYAQNRTVPLHWIWIGVILTLLESSNADWTWVAPNILLSFALIRLARPYVQMLVQRHGWAAFVLLVSTFLAVLPVAAKIVDYGAEGWLWALFGLYQRQYVDGISARRQRRRNSTPVSIHVGCDPDRRPDAASGLLGRCGRLRLAGTKGVLVSSNSFSCRYFGPRRSVRQPVSIQAWREPHPTSRENSQHSSLHWSVHSGNIRYPACRLRAHCKVGARSRHLTPLGASKKLPLPRFRPKRRPHSAYSGTDHFRRARLGPWPALGVVRGIGNSVGAQESSLTIIISTQAPTDADLLSILIDDALAGHDPHVVAKLYTAPPELDPFAEDTIRLANPTFDAFMNSGEVLAMAADAKRMPAREAEYRNLVLLIERQIMAQRKARCSQSCEKASCDNRRG